VSECADGHCMTCSDEAVRVHVVEARPGAVALCEGDLEVMTDLVGAVGPGDLLLVHAGVALARVER
jgi:hydrogenase maturation factor